MLQETPTVPMCGSNINKLLQASTPSAIISTQVHMSLYCSVEVTDFYPQGYEHYHPGIQ
jgi:hypothetical protein